MALYEYKCERCGDVFELIQKFSDAPLTIHEGCGGPVHRLISTSALQFKGSGWYVNDYAKGKKSPASDGDGSAKKSDTATESSKTSDKTSDSKASPSTDTGKSPTPAPATTTPTSDTK